MPRIFSSPGPVYEPESASRDYWRAGRALYAAGFRAGDLVQESLLRLWRELGRGTAIRSPGPRTEIMAVTAIEEESRVIEWWRRERQVPEGYIEKYLYTHRDIGSVTHSLRVASGRTRTCWCRRSRARRPSTPRSTRSWTATRPTRGSSSSRPSGRAWRRCGPGSVCIPRHDIRALCTETTNTSCPTGDVREIWYTGPGPDAKWEIAWLFK